MSETLAREELGDGIWLSITRSISRGTSTFGLEMADERRWDDRDEFRRVLSQKMNDMYQRIMDGWDIAKAKEDGEG